MIKYKKGNIINEPVEALVNTVNTVGIMGKGIALAFKKAFPDNYKIYKNICDKNEFDIGDILITETGSLLPKYIINFPTKRHWRNRSEMEYIEKGMKELIKKINEYGIQSIAIPPLGCGNGGLKWNDVIQIILDELATLNDDIDIVIFEPGFNEQTMPTKKHIELTPARAMFLSALNKYRILGYSVNLLVAQKIAYFLQQLNEPLNLDFEKGFYGPYSNRLQHLLKYLNGYYLVFDNESTKPDSIITLKRQEEVSHFVKSSLSDEQKSRLEVLQQLIEGFESPYGLELLATVDFIIQHNKISDINDIENIIADWTKRKREIMKPYHIEKAYRRLQELYNSNTLLV